MKMSKYVAGAIITDKIPLDSAEWSDAAQSWVTSEEKPVFRVISIQESGEWLLGKAFTVTAETILEGYKGRAAGDVFSFEIHPSHGDLGGA
jgi:hypothetical protein